MISLMSTMQWALVYPHQRAAAPHATHAFLCTYLSKESAKQPASPLSALPLSSRHVHIANDDTKQLQDSNQMHVCFSPELSSELTPVYEL